MVFIYRFFVLILFILFTFSSNAHVEHYKKLNRIKFDIYRNNQHIGSHIFSFNREGEDLKVKSIINIFFIVVKNNNFFKINNLKES